MWDGEHSSGSGGLEPGQGLPAQLGGLHCDRGSQLGTPQLCSPGQHLGAPELHTGARASSRAWGPQARPGEPLGPVPTTKPGSSRGSGHGAEGQCGGTGVTWGWHRSGLPIPTSVLSQGISWGWCCWEGSSRTPPALPQPGSPRGSDLGTQNSLINVTLLYFLAWLKTV